MLGGVIRSPFLLKSINFGAWWIVHYPEYGDAYPLFGSSKCIVSMGIIAGT